MEAEAPLRHTINRIINDAEAKALPGVPSGLVVLDRITSGWKPGCLHIVAGGASSGCTSLLLTCMRNAVTDFKRSVAFFSLQLSSKQLLTKWLSMEMDVDYQSLQNGNLPDYKWAEIGAFTPRLQESLDGFAHILDAAAPTIDSIAADCHRLQEEGVELFLIDNLHRITLTKEQRTYCANREQEISYIVRRLKSLARELDAPVVLVSHLSRPSGDKWRPKRPQLSDLRDSGAIEYEADVVLMLYRAEMYGYTEDEMGNPTHNVADLIVAKNTFGDTDTAQVRFRAKLGKFDDLPEGNYNGYAGDMPKSSFDDAPAGFAPNTIRLGSRMRGETEGRTNWSNEEPPF